MGWHPGRQARSGGATELTYAAVLAPGYGGSADQPILRAISASLQKVGITPRAISFSRGRPSGDFSGELDDLRHARDELMKTADSIALVGRSFGGRMCTRLAALEPPDALVVLGHPISPSDRPRPDDEAALLAVRCPTLIVQGDHDHLGPLSVLTRIARQNENIEIYVLKNTGHNFGARQSEGVERAATWLLETFRH